MDVDEIWRLVDLSQEPSETLGNTPDNNRWQQQVLYRLLVNSSAEHHEFEGDTTPNKIKNLSG